MNYFLQQCLGLMFSAIEACALVFEIVVGEFGLVLIFGLAISVVVFRLIIKPITGYGVGSDSSKPKKDEKGE